MPKGLIIYKIKNMLVELSQDEINLVISALEIVKREGGKIDALFFLENYDLLQDHYVDIESFLLKLKKL